MRTRAHSKIQLQYNHHTQSAAPQNGEVLRISCFVGIGMVALLFIFNRSSLLLPWTLR
jgi:hypothetical protein